MVHFSKKQKDVFKVVFYALVLFVFLFLAGKVLNQLVFPSSLKVAFLQVDRGDSIYINTPHRKEIVIDGALNNSVLSGLERHRPFWDRHIDMLIVTHPDSDHYQGFLEVLDRFSVDNILLTGLKKEDEQYQFFLKKLEEKGVNILYADKAKDFEVDGVRFDVISPLFSHLNLETKKTNSSSLVIKMTYANEEGEKSILFTGDIEEKQEEKILLSGVDIKADVLKVPHHGSKSSSTENFLKAVAPQFAVFTTGTKNSFGHPHDEILERYENFGIPFENSRDGDVVMEW